MAVRWILARLLPHASENLWMRPPFRYDYGRNIYCGHHVYFDENCVVFDAARILIGPHVLFRPGVQLYTATRRTLELAPGPSPLAMIVGWVAGPSYAPA